MGEDARSVNFPKEAALILFNQSASMNFLKPYEDQGMDISRELIINDVFREQYFQVYRNGLDSYFENIIPYVQASPSNILDIGCGLGLVPLLISRYLDHDPDLWMHDRSVAIENAQRAFGRYHPEGYVFTASLPLTHEFLIMNGIDEDRIHLVEASEDAIKTLSTVDLVLSRNSWGFHYPLETYIDDVCDLLDAKGRLILDIRKGTGASEILHQRFSYIEILEDAPKSLRIAASNSPL